MKRIFLGLAGALMLLSTACNQSDDFAIIDNKPSEQAKKALLQMYPDAQNVSWESRGLYVVADFTQVVSRATVAVEYSAWFDNGGSWYMTESDMRYDDLPAAVKSAFEASEYAQWRIDDVDCLEREGMETIYVIEIEGVENGQEKEYDLYYTADGVLSKTVADEDDDYDYEDYIPAKPFSGIEDFLQAHYPGARIVEIDYEDGRTEVEVVHNGKKKDIYFNSANEWLRTEWDVRKSELPSAVSAAINGSAYSDYRIDDIDFVETPAEAYFKIELEKGEREVQLRITAEGTIL